VKTIITELVAITKDLGLYDGLRLEFIKNDFQTLFPALSDHLYPSFFNNGQLLILVDSREWLSEVRLRSEEIVKRLSSHGVRSVRFKLGRIPRKKGGSPSRPTHETHPPEDVIESITSEIKDPELKNALSRAVRASMRRKKR
jgi:hypothetical protein